MGAQTQNWLKKIRQPNRQRAGKIPKQLTNQLFTGNNTKQVDRDTDNLAGDTQWDELKWTGNKTQVKHISKQLRWET